MLEAYSGSRPGRPARLLILSALVLIASLGIAWLQTQAKRALDTPRPLPNSPLVIRPPRGWSEAQSEPGVFFLQERSDPQASEFALQRRVQFVYRRLPLAPSAERQIAALRRQDVVRSSSPLSTSISGLPALQVVRWHGEQRAFNVIVRKESLLRVAVHPRGDVISVEYWPAQELTQADLQFFDDICNSIQFTDPVLRLSGAAAMKHAGVHFPLAPDWSVVGPIDESLRGLYVSGGGGNEQPWTVGIHETFFHGDRDAAALLRDHASQLAVAPLEFRVIEWARRDHVEVAALEPATRRDAWLARAAFMLRSPRGAPMMITVRNADGPNAAAADAARRLADTVAFEPDTEPRALAEAERSGFELAERITQIGARPWWGRRDDRADYLVAFGLGALAASQTRRVAEPGAVDAGYVGAQAVTNSVTLEYARAKWSLDSRAFGYEFELESGTVRELLRGAQRFERRAHLRESRSSAGGGVTRSVRVADAAPRETTFAVGRGFVCPPAESVLHSLVASREPPSDALVEVSTLFGRGAAARLVRALAPLSAGARRVLIVDDWSPEGRIESYDADGRALGISLEGVRLPRIDSRRDANRSIFALIDALLQ